MILEWMQMTLAILIVIPCALLVGFVAGQRTPQQD